MHIDALREEQMPKDDSMLTTGIIFPFLPKHTERFFENGKTVFVKFFGNQRSPLRLNVGSKLYFYESEGNKEIVGQATVSEISSGTADEVESKYGSALFLTPEELNEYARERRERRMLVLVVKDAKRYKIPLKLEKSVTMGGQYMTRRMFQNLQMPRMQK